MVIIKSYKHLLKVIIVTTTYFYHVVHILQLQLLICLWSSNILNIVIIYIIPYDIQSFDSTTRCPEHLMLIAQLCI